jgi:hypothetical protein
VSAETIANLGILAAQVEGAARRPAGKHRHRLLVEGIHRRHHAGRINLTPQMIEPRQEAHPAGEPIAGNVVEVEIGDLKFGIVGIGRDHERFQPAAQVGRAVVPHPWQDDVHRDACASLAQQFGSDGPHIGMFRMKRRRFEDFARIRRQKRMGAADVPGAVVAQRANERELIGQRREQRQVF